MTDVPTTLLEDLRSAIRFHDWCQNTGRDTSLSVEWLVESARKLAESGEVSRG